MRCKDLITQGYGSPAVHTACMKGLPFTGEDLWRALGIGLALVGFGALLYALFTKRPE